jgi:hypothetical protein
MVVSKKESKSNLVRSRFAFVKDKTVSGSKSSFLILKITCLLWAMEKILFVFRIMNHYMCSFVMCFFKISLLLRKLHRHDKRIIGMCGTLR